MAISNWFRSRINPHPNLLPEGGDSIAKSEFLSKKDAIVRKNDPSFSTNDIRICVTLLGVLFLLTPFFPQLIYPGFTFFYRSTFFLLFAFLGVRWGRERFSTVLFENPIVIPTLIAILYTALGLCHAPDFYQAESKVVLLICILVMYWVFLAFPLMPRTQTILLACLTLGGTGAALHGLTDQWMGHSTTIQSLQTTTLYPDDMKKEMILSLTANRAMGRFGNPNQLAGYLVLSLWPLWLLWKAHRNRHSRRLLSAAAFLIIAGIYRTYSRSGLLVLAFSFGCIGVYELYEQGMRISRKTIIGTGLAIMVVMAGMAFFAPHGLLGGRLTTISTIAARMDFYRGAILVIQANPWLGVGPEGFESAYCGVLRPPDMEARYPHNVFLETSVEGGIFGIVLLFWILLAFRESIRQHRKRKDIPSEILLAASGAAGSLLLLSLVDFHNNLLEMWTIPVFLAGMTEATSWTIHRQARSIRPLVTIAMTVAAVWIVLVLCRFWNETARTDGQYLLAGGQKSEARTAYERAVLFDRTDAESWRQLGLIWAEITNPIAQQHRLDCLQRAVYWAPGRASLHADYADTLFALGYPEQAAKEMKIAQRLFPSRPVYYERLAVIYRYLGREKEARTLEENAQSLKEIKANRL